MCSLVICMLTASQVNAVTNNGEAGSPERQDYCKSKLRSCNSDATKFCDKYYGLGTNYFNDCKRTEGIKCSRTYGGVSDCMTRDLRTKSNRKIESVMGGQVKAAPKSSTGLKKSRFKNKATSPLGVKKTEVPTFKKRLVSPKNIVTPNNRSTTKTQVKIDSKKTKKIRDKRINKKENKDNKKTIKSSPTTVNFDEADALFGKIQK